MKAPEQARHEPYDIPVEQALLGAMLLDSRSINRAAANLSSEHFYDQLHARLFDLIVHLSTEGDVSPIIVNALMKTDPGLIELGGISYLSTLAQAAPSMPDVKRMGKIIIELSRRRGLIRIGKGLVNNSYESPRKSPARMLADKATEELLRVGADARAPMLTPYKTALASAHEIERIWRGEQKRGVTTGLEKLDEETGGFQPGDFVTIAGKPGMGKSALMGSISVHAAMAGVPTYVFSLEMSRKQWVNRLVCDLDFTGEHISKPLWYSNARNGRFTSAKLGRFALAARDLERPAACRG